MINWTGCPTLDPYNCSLLMIFLVGPAASKLAIG
jgi:hypothetical protein